MKNSISLRHSVLVLFIALLAFDQAYANRDKVDPIPPVVEDPSVKPEKKPEPVVEEEPEEVVEAPAPEVEDLRLNPHSLDQYRTSMGVTTLRQMIAQRSSCCEPLRKVRVAILDKGFYGWEKRVGRSLPRDVEYIQGPLKSADSTPHGTLMAEILTSMLWGAEWEPPQKDNLTFELRLYNVAGFSNFKAAIDDVLREEVDMVLYSEVWELGGNGDGRGFINREVNRATKAGVIWLNAAGNFGGRVYNAPIRVLDNNLVKLPDERSSLVIECEPPQGVEVCPAKITLNWNSFSSDSEKGTDKDLDLALFTEDFKKVQVSLLKQKDMEADAGPGQSKYPREAITAQLKPGRYRIMVRSLGQTWHQRDRIRILVDGDFLSMPRGDYEETLQNPADNRTVITVGASDSERSSASVSLGKPEIKGPSNVQEHFGRQFRGSSNAAAIAMSKAVLMKYLNPEMDRETMIQALLSPVDERMFGGGQQMGYSVQSSESFEVHQAGGRLRQRWTAPGDRRAITPQPYNGFDLNQRGGQLSDQGDYQRPYNGDGESFRQLPSDQFSEQ